MSDFPAFNPTSQVQNVTGSTARRPFPAVITSYDARQRNQRNMDFFNTLEQKMTIERQNNQAKEVFGYPPYGRQ